MAQRIYQKSQKNIPGWGYWGDFGDIEIGLSCGREESGENTSLDKIHYHKEGVVFILVTQGSGIIEVDGQEIEISQDEVLRIAPREKYRHHKATQVPFSWITICTIKDSEDKVAEE